ncbi:hypothetical protein NQ315_009771 [Exocentrus adspersus]|uniref:NADH dehydrogenase [ubiquinone] 1 alpha subcomplex subunit 11 n=1 Tax=Exocentrus adspersus TaxID=1586481 RepID=A0AAV8WH90_9CUCU|nr:hypothetical protein NQ315_009771 [Exocentrus adspersus]
MSAKVETRPYRYFDTPDGQDTFKKLWAAMKPTGAVALGVATTDVMLYSHPKGYLPTLARFATIGLPIVGVTTTFVCTTNAVASLRKKDDALNWFVGGFAAGCLFGFITRKATVGFNMGMLLGVAATLRKYSMETELVGSPDLKTHGFLSGVPVYPLFPDMTLTEQRPGNWITGKQ